MGADIVVIGAGAAGFFAALHAAGAGRRVVLLEKNRQPGLKILISGGGRCNLTTTRSGADLEREYGTRRGRWLRHALRAFSPAHLRARIEAAGVPLHEEDLEKIFPVSGRARDVVDALSRMAAAAGVEFVGESPMTSLRRQEAGFVVETPRGPVDAERVVLATGGLSYPKTGTTGDGYAACRALGHAITPTLPALAPLAVDAPWVHNLAGIAMPLPLTLLDASGRVLNRRFRPVLFTHRGLSGPAAMDLAGDVEEQGGGCRLRIDFAPEATAEAIAADLVAAGRQRGGRLVFNCLPHGIPERVRQHLVATVGASGAIASLQRTQRHALVRAVKQTEVPVERSLGFAHAEVTRGGVDLAEVDPRTMQSRLVPGLFICGELLDVDGPIGGFNFQAAFATGRLAGLAAADRGS